MAIDESTAAAPRGNPSYATVDHVSIAQTLGGDKLAVVVTLTVEVDATTALDLVLQAVGAIVRMRRVD
jgi:hypothetical protein